MSNILLPGTTLKDNSYRVQHLLGQGGFGNVYLADDLIMNRPCAIKESFDNSPGAQAQFEVEARILANLSHSHLPRVTDNFIEPSGQQYLVMEYVEGEDLGALLERSGPLPEGKVRDWMDQVLDAVAYLHAYQPRPVIHRDMKPDNIRLLPDGKTVKLVDFGIAKIGGASVGTRRAAWGVTPGFSPLEQYSNLPSSTGTDTYSDVYALGATLYNLLTNTVPPEATARGPSGAQLAPPRHLNPQISADMEQIILTAIQMDPHLRFPNAGEMRQALRGQRPPTVSLACPHCHAPVRAGARFCPACGRPVGRVAPFVFQKANCRAKDVKELVRGCDTHWEEALDYFRRGDFDAWLRQLGPAGGQLAAQAQAIRATHSDPSAALQEFLQVADPTRSLPLLTTNPVKLDLGPLRAGDSKVVAVTVANSGRGYLHGTVQVRPAWIQVHPANFGCRAGKAQQIDVEVKTAGLSGTELGVDYGGQVTILSSRGQQSVPVRLKVVDEPQAHLEPAQVDLGQAAWGDKVRGQVTVSNRGGGTLHGALVTDDSWIAIDPAGHSFALRKGAELPIALAVDTAQLARRGLHSGQLQVQTKGRGNPVATVTIRVDLPYPLDPAQPTTAVNTVADLIATCDASWDWGLHHLAAGRIEAFLRFIGEDGLAQVAAGSRQHPDPNAGLEALLRATGAEPPAKHRTNVDEVIRLLGFGPFPKLGRKPPVVKLFIENTSPRGYLHGQVTAFAPWLKVPQLYFGCLPGQVAEVELHVDHKAKKGGLFSLGTELFELEVI